MVEILRRSTSSSADITRSARNISIIPAIIARNITEVQVKIKQVQAHAQWVHLDIMDGKFVPNTTWNNPNELMHMRLPLKVEVHLMVEKPEDVYLDWVLAGASRIIWHYEATTKHSDIAADVRRRGVETGIALNPETSVDAVNPLTSEVDMILLMANTPGFGGQEFLEETPEKISALRAQWPEGIIGVDIGINPETAQKAVGVGADVLIAGSYIFGADDPLMALDELKSLPY